MGYERQVDKNGRYHSTCGFRYCRSRGELLRPASLQFCISNFNFFLLLLFHYRIVLGMLRVNLLKVLMLLLFNTNQARFILLLICPPLLTIFDLDVMQVAHHFFENGIAHFTRRINKCISLGCANGEVAPFVGHNSFLRWSAIQDAAFIDPEDQVKKIWSESNVSEDFDMALRLQVRSIW